MICKRIYKKLEKRRGREGGQDLGLNLGLECRIRLLRPTATAGTNRVTQALGGFIFFG